MSMIGRYRSLKTGNIYYVSGERLNAQNGEIMVCYENEAEEKFCREIGEFQKKFVKDSNEQ